MKVSSCKIAILTLTLASISSAQDCVDPNLANIKSGVEIMLCDGSKGVGTLVVCDATTTENCVVSSGYRAAAKTKLTSENIKSGVSVGGVSGSMRAVKRCRNGNGVVYETATAWAGDIRNPGSTALDISSVSTNITLNGGIGDLRDLLESGDVVTVGSDSRTIVSITSSTVAVVDSPFSATLSAQDWSYVKTGLVSNVDDYTNGMDPYTGPDATNCGPENFSDVTSTVAPYLPDSSKHASWTKIGRDELTGVEFTNMLDSAQNAMQAAAICTGLNDGTGGNGWRMPGQKELLQLYIDGISNFDSSFAISSTNRGRVWSNTSNSAVTDLGITVALGQGVGDDESGKGLVYGVICVRDPQ